MESVKEQIKNLVNLQGVDSKILSLRHQREQKPAYLKALETELNEKKKECALFEEGLKKFQVEQKEKELELKAKEESIRKFQVQLSQVKTNKEYQSLQKEIEGLKADGSILEEGILKILDEIDSYREKIKKAREVQAEEESKFNEQKKIIETEIAVIDCDLEQLNKEREKITLSIEKELLARYERVLKNKNGLAIVPVKGDACSGCFMNLPPQTINEIRMGKNIIVCDNCNRMLYIEDIEAERV